MPRTRPVTVDDAAELAAALAANRDFMAPWDAIRPDAFYTAAGQEAELGRLVAAAEAGTTCARVIVDDDGAIAGGIRLTDVVRGAFESGTLGYWVLHTANGRGYASAAVAETVDLAFGALRLHRVQAATLLHNARSQRVLAKNGFERIGTARGYVRIAGEWQDHHLFQRLAP